MKIQINNLAALERLIGGDTEVELEIRGNIVQEFTKKHLKALATETVLRKVADDVRAASETNAREATTQALNKLGMFTGQRWNQTFVLQPEIKQALRDSALSEVRAAIDHAVNEALSRYDRDLIKRQIDKAITSNIESQISDGVKLKLREITGKMLS